MRWPTRDGVVPAALFFALEAESAHVAAAEQLQHYYAGLLAGAQVHGSKESKAARDEAVRTLTALAYPEVSGE
jgi:hypothetical protein